MKSWIINIEEDENGELYLPLNQDILDLTKWKEGDIIEWLDNKDGSWTMKLKEDMEWVLVDTVSQFQSSVSRSYEQETFKVPRLLRACINAPFF